VSALVELKNRIQNTNALIAEHERVALEIGVQPPQSLLINIRSLEKLKKRLEAEYLSIAAQNERARPKIAIRRTDLKDPLRGIDDLLISPPVKLGSIADRLGLKIFVSSQLPDGASPLPVGASGMLTNDPLLAGVSGFGIVVRSEDSADRKRFTIGHEIGHFLLHRDLLIDGVVVDMAVLTSRAISWKPNLALYRSNLNSSIENKADSVAADILMPWELLAPVINKKPSELEELFGVSRPVVDIRLTHPTAIKLKQGPKIDPVLEDEFKALVAKWHSDNPGEQSTPESYRHPSYRRIREMNLRAIPLLLIELRDRPNDVWMVALKSITSKNVASTASTFEEAVRAWLAWGRAHGHLS
jgi:Zn-dependent peptidase ImmA (M78 family)